MYKTALTQWGVLTGKPNPAWELLQKTWI